MVDNKVAVIHHNKNSYFANEIQKSGVKVISAYRKTNLFMRVLRRAHFKANLPAKDIWYRKTRELKNYNTLIIFDAALRKDFVQMIRQIYPNKRLILWYWNPVRNSIPPESLDRGICEKWSYSIKDCEKYNLKYNTTFYFNNLTTKADISNLNINCDIYFIGRDKGRLHDLLDYQRKFIGLGLKTNFHITPTRRYRLKSNKIYRKGISYDEVITQINKSKAILDIVQDQNDGLTLRAMESIFHKKKLITNSRIIEDYDFYNPNNIFILGKDDLYELSSFVNKPYEEIDSQIIKKYDFTNWIENFFNVN